MSEPAQPPFTAWFRYSRREPWKVLVTGDSEDEVVGEALRKKLGGDWCFLAVGRNPNEKRAVK